MQKKKLGGTSHDAWGSYRKTKESEGGYQKTQVHKKQAWTDAGAQKTSEGGYQKTQQSSRGWTDNWGGENEGAVQQWQDTTPAQQASKASWSTAPQQVQKRPTPQISRALPKCMDYVKGMCDQSLLDAQIAALPVHSEGGALPAAVDEVASSNQQQPESATLPTHCQAELATETLRTSADLCMDTEPKDSRHCAEAGLANPAVPPTSANTSSSQQADRHELVTERSPIVEQHDLGAEEPAVLEAGVGTAVGSRWRDSFASTGVFDDDDRGSAFPMPRPSRPVRAVANPISDAEGPWGGCAAWSRTKAGTAPVPPVVSPDTEARSVDVDASTTGRAQVVAGPAAQWSRKPNASSTGSVDAEHFMIASPNRQPAVASGIQEVLDQLPTDAPPGVREYLASLAAKDRAAAERCD